MDPYNQSDFVLSVLNDAADDVLAHHVRLMQPSDGERLLSYCDRHGLSPLMYSRLNSLDNMQFLGSSAFSQFHIRFIQNAARNALFMHELSGLLSVLNSRGIPLILLKGAHLITDVYENVALRRMCDVDVLAQKNDIGCIIEALEEINCVASETFDIDAICSKQQHIPLYRKPPLFAIEVHWNIEPPEFRFDIDVDGLWHRAKPIALGDTCAMRLSSEDVLLNLILHLLRHNLNFYSLRALYDIKKVCEKYREEIDWEQLIERAQKWNVAPFVYLVLGLVKELLAAPVPEYLSKPLNQIPELPKLLKLAESVVIEDVRTEMFGDNFARLWERKRFWDKATHFFCRAIPSPEEMEKRYGIQNGLRLYLLGYPRHLRGRIARNGSGLLRILTGMAKSNERLTTQRKKVIIQDWINSNR